MTRQITQRELRNDSAAILRAVEAGESFILTCNGTPIAEVRPIRRRTFVPVAELKSAFAHVPKLDYGQLRADIDEFVDQTPHDPYGRFRKND
ncbi:type II toxin-antitoxin system Phd/YefM family antitoxin [Kutzneria sp. CA-103260]|uniref:type II toxin-antitoxin system Phd/YefM family antitoxin n=1 Tax=Kutzneria sp. CA-103260 TaxID=2802641 RepID=UPI001BA9892C|nr:type II toxin-antitoxin system prevent-host-death family antitoxin [Kutzneria sp. CA-103260]QUQ68076.1 Putative antitoxin VapB5 [Kutzneria sp. CA-103260]